MSAPEIRQNDGFEVWWSGQRLATYTSEGQAEHFVTLVRPLLARVEVLEGALEQAAMALETTGDFVRDSMFDGREVGTVQGIYYDAAAARHHLRNTKPTLLPPQDARIDELTVALGAALKAGQIKAAVRISAERATLIHKLHHPNETEEQRKKRQEREVSDRG